MALCTYFSRHCVSTLYRLFFYCNIFTFSSPFPQPLLRKYSASDVNKPNSLLCSRRTQVFHKLLHPSCHTPCHTPCRALFFLKVQSIFKVFITVHSLCIFSPQPYIFNNASSLLCFPHIHFFFMCRIMRVPEGAWEFLKEFESLKDYETSWMRKKNKTCVAIQET